MTDESEGEADLRGVSRIPRIIQHIQFPRTDSNDKALNERLVPYFYEGIEPEQLRSLVQHFRVEHVSDVFDQFRVQCTASVVEMVNLKR